MESTDKPNPTKYLEKSMSTVRAVANRQRELKKDSRIAEAIKLIEEDKLIPENIGIMFYLGMCMSYLEVANSLSGENPTRSILYGCIAGETAIKIEEMYDNKSS